MLVELFHILRRLDASNDNAFGFTVAAKAAPGADDRPWIESVHADSPSVAKLVSGQTIIRINDFDVAGLTAKEVRLLVQKCGIKLKLVVKNSSDDLIDILIWRGRLGCLRDLASRWCRRMENSVEGDCSSSQTAIAAVEVQRALQTFLIESERLELSEMCDDLLLRGSKCQGVTNICPVFNLHLASF